MAIEIREPPVDPGKPELTLWLNELREKLVSQIDELMALTVHVGTGPTAVYWGSGEGAWRLIRDGNDFSAQRRESGVWVEKGAWEAV